MVRKNAGPGFSELLKPDIVVPLLENLQLEERLAPYLPEVSVTNFHLSSCAQCSFSPEIACWVYRVPNPRQIHGNFK
jgi:hypothetical protein